MSLRKEITLDKTAVSRAVRKPLEAYYTEVGSDGYDGSSERPGNWEYEEELITAICKSKYVSSHLDVEYILELVFAVLDHYPELTAATFAEKLEQVITDTVEQRDYLAIVPLAFTEILKFHPLQKKSLRRPVSIGEFTFWPPASSVKAINKILATHEFPPITESDFQHATRMTRAALSREILVTFNMHGAEDRLRFSVDSKFRVLCRLIELFANLFTTNRAGFGQTGTVNHFFLRSKVGSEFRRIPTSKSFSFDFELSSDLLSSIKRPELNEFFVDMFSSKESMYGRMRNATKFFSMAFNANDDVTSFLFYVIAIESIFSKDKNAPIKATLADLGAMLCFPPEQRRGGYEMIRRAYDKRSAIVHSGVTSVEKEDINTVRLIAARATYCTLHLCSDLKTGGGKLEQKFFDHLRDRKLGVAKPVIPRAIWSLPPIGNDHEDSSDD